MAFRIDESIAWIQYRIEAWHSFQFLNTRDMLCLSRDVKGVIPHMMRDLASLQYEKYCHQQKLQIKREWEMPDRSSA